jgi:hypothetical protein
MTDDDKPFSVDLLRATERNAESDSTHACTIKDVCHCDGETCACNGMCPICKECFICATAGDPP